MHITMRKITLFGLLIASVLTILVGCSTMKPQDIVHATKDISYHYWHNERNRERGIKYNIVFIYILFFFKVRLVQYLYAQPLFDRIR